MAALNDLSFQTVALRWPLSLTVASQWPCGLTRNGLMLNIRCSMAAIRWLFSQRRFSRALRSDAQRPDARWLLLGKLSFATATLRTCTSPAAFKNHIKSRTLREPNHRGLFLDPVRTSCGNRLARPNQSRDSPMRGSDTDLIIRLLRPW